MAQKEETSQNISKENQGKKLLICGQLTEDKSAKDIHLGKEGPLNKLRGPLNKERERGREGERERGRQAERE